MSSVEPLLDAAGRRRSPATTPGFRAGIAPRNKGQRYPADPPTVDEIVAVMRQAERDRHGHRLSALIVVLWRAGLRIHEALSLTETDLDERRGSILVRHGKNDRRREVGMDAWGWSAIEPWLADRVRSPGRTAVLRDRRSDPRPRLVSQLGADRAAPSRAQGRSTAAVRAAPAAPRARRRIAARRDRAAADPAPARPLAPLNDPHLPSGHRHRGDHLDRPRQAGANDARQRRPRPVAAPAGAHPALPHPGPCSTSQAAATPQPAMLLALSSSDPGRGALGPWVAA